MDMLVGDLQLWDLLLLTTTSPQAHSDCLSRNMYSHTYVGSTFIHSYMPQGVFLFVCNGL